VIIPRAGAGGAWRRGRWLRLVREVSAFVRQLRSRRFDVVIDAQGCSRVGCGHGSPALGSASASDQEGSARLMTRHRQAQGHKRIGAEYRHLIRALGLDGESFPMDIALTPQDQVFAQEFTERGIAAGLRGHLPFTTRPRHWVETRWPELAWRFAVELGLPVVMLGGRRTGQQPRHSVHRPRHRRSERLPCGRALPDRARIPAGRRDTALTTWGPPWVPTVACLAPPVLTS
jgi:heptosyltransferase-1